MLRRLPPLIKTLYEKLMQPPIHEELICVWTSAAKFAIRYADVFIALKVLQFIILKVVVFQKIASIGNFYK